MRANLLRFATAVASLGVLVGIFPMHHHSAEATLPGTNGRVAFTVDANGEKHVWTMNASGGDRQQVTTDAGQTDYTPSWSPDGKQIVYRTTYDTGPPGGGLRIVNLESTQDIALLNTETAFQPKFAPEGQRLVYNEDLGAGEFDIILLDLFNFTKQNITQSVGFQELSPIFSPDSDTIAFVGESPGGASDIWITTPNVQATPTKISDTPAEIKQSVDFSPDGKSLVFDFTADSGVTSHIARINVDGSDYTPLTSGNFFDIFPRFSPDGEHIIFERQSTAAINAVRQGPGTSSRIMVMGANGGTPSPLSTGDAPQDSAPDWQSIARVSAPLTWGDNDCSGGFTTADAVVLLQEAGGVAAAGGEAIPQGACAFPVGTDLLTSFGSRKFGDLNCNGDVDAPDALIIMREVAQLPPGNLQDCPAIGIEVQVTR